MRPSLPNVSLRSQVFAFGRPSGDWERWFAWRPVITWDHRIAWGVWVMRIRQLPNSGYEALCEKWVYALVEQDP